MICPRMRLNAVLETIEIKNFSREAYPRSLRILVVCPLCLWKTCLGNNVPQVLPIFIRFQFCDDIALQIVGICDEELHAAQQWNGFSTLELLRRIP